MITKDLVVWEGTVFELIEFANGMLAVNFLTWLLTIKIPYDYSKADDPQDHFWDH